MSSLFAVSAACLQTHSHGASVAQALAVASRQVGSLAAQTAELQAQQAAHLAWTGRSLVLSSLDSMEVATACEYRVMCSEYAQSSEHQERLRATTTLLRGSIVV